MGKTHTLQGIRDDCPQVDNKRLEMIEWCQQKEELEGETMLQPEEPGGATLDQGGSRTLTLGIQGVFHPTLGTQEHSHPTLGTLEVSQPTLSI